ncbi:unnamed protein product [marine sediment metagenome]|uniref:TGS domain-containing protein n=1 Tax=marine sediment metagenome TaxID=412755 RepID=X0VMD9_9ZZZZ
MTHLDNDLIKSISSEYVTNADVIVREDITEDQLIDVFVQNRIYVPALVVINKTDLISEKELISRIRVIKQKGWIVLSISAVKGRGLNLLKEKMFSELRFIRVYMKPIGKQVDFDDPLILKEGATIEVVCKKLHRDFRDKFRYASVSGPSAKHDIQKVGLDHVLKDEDILTIVITR